MGEIDTKHSAERCLIVHNEDYCQECGALGRVYALIFPHETTYEDDESETGVSSEGYALSLSYVTEMSSRLADHLRRLGATMRLSPSKTAGQEYIANRCPHCDALRGDYFLWKPEGPFWTFDDAPRPKLGLISEPVWARTGQWGNVPFALDPYADFEPPPAPRRRSRAQRILK